MHTLEFWFDPASTYSYLSSQRIAKLCDASGLELLWRPFLLGPIFAAQGWNDSPFNLYPAKGEYMWRDMQRRTRALGLPFTRPASFPQHSVLAARVALSAAERGCANDIVPLLYRANFAEGQDISTESNLRSILEADGHDASALLSEAMNVALKARLRAQTERAGELGIFGAPSFRIRGELYWGDDRLDEAVASASL